MSMKNLAPTYFNRLDRTKSNIEKGLRILNVGCSDGEYDRQLSVNFKQTFGIDINRDDILSAKNYAKKNNFYTLADGSRIPFQDNIFDAVICIDVLEHIPNEKKVLSEIYRVMKKNATLVLTVPHNRYPWTYDPINAFLKPFGKHLPIGIWAFGHTHLYEIKTLEKKITEIGFRVEKREYLNHSLAGIFENYLSSIFSRKVKPDPKNLTKRKNVSSKCAPKFALRAVSYLLKIDENLFRKSKTSVGILVKAKK